MHPAHALDRVIPPNRQPSTAEEDQGSAEHEDRQRVQQHREQHPLNERYDGVPAAGRGPARREPVLRYPVGDDGSHLLRALLVKLPARLSP